ncbi:MAG: hypothetical protein M9953_00415 [Thermomicrobiales bacterium]|nr:hypothetical protein [Thermomicrobiales bacterium]MCO5223785.1 hypothetical protein [Thermomicrobiales bacterium]
MKRATVSLWFDSDPTSAAHRLLHTHVQHMNGRVAVLPSSLDALDPFAEAVRSVLPADTESFVALPVTGAAARRAFITPSVLGSWIDRRVVAQGATVGSVTFPQDIAQAAHRIVVTDVVEVARRGPFVLDLPARYIHPRQRMRLLASGEREALAAEVGSAFPVDLVAVFLALRDGVVLAVTSDVIAAELVALAMSELCIGAPRSFTGPWEDKVVQRATELQMGVGLPSYLGLVANGPHRADAWAERIHEHIRIRLGIPELAGNG